MINDNKVLKIRGEEILYSDIKKIEKIIGKEVEVGEDGFYKYFNSFYIKIFLKNSKVLYTDEYINEFRLDEAVSEIAIKI